MKKNLIAIIALTAALAASTSAFADTVQISEEELNKPVSTYAPDAMPTPEIQGDIMLLNGEEKDAKIVEILPVDGVRYTVPKYIRPTEMDDTLTVRFRVGAVYKNCAIATYFDDQLISKRKRPVMAPGEMEQVILDKKKLNEHPDLSKITIKIEEA